MMIEFTGDADIDFMRRLIPQPAAISATTAPIAEEVIQARR